MTRVVKILLYLELIRFLQFVDKQVESSLSSPPPSQFHLLLSLFAPMGETQLRVLTKGMKVFDMGQYNSTFRECSPLRIRSSFKRFLHSISKVLGVVQSTKCFVLNDVRNRVQVFNLCCQKFFVPRYRLCRHPRSRPSAVTFFADVPVSPISKVA